jgi:hypothetical protein
MRKYLVPLLVLASTLVTHAQTPTTIDLLKQAQAAITQALTNLTPAPPAPSTTITVAAGGDLQAALNTVTCGGTVALTSGATYTGNYTLPNRLCGSAPVTITTDAITVAPGQVSPAISVPFAKLTSPNTSPVLSTKVSSHDWKLKWLEVKAGAGLYPFGIITIGAGDSTQTTLAQVPMHFTIDQCYIHGDPVTGAKFGIAFNGGDITLTNSYVSDAKGNGQDAQAVVGTNGPGPFLIANNYLEGAGENVLFGGADPTIPGLIPSDIIISGNFISKPVAWRTQSWSVKNLLELKNAQRVHIFNNVLEYSWVKSQVGFGLMITVRDQSGHCPWCTVQDVEIDHDVIRHVNQGINILGLDDDKDATGAIFPSARANHINIHDLLVYDVGGSTWGIAGQSNVTTDFIVNNGPMNVSVTHSTFVGKTTKTLALTLGLSQTPSANLQITCNVINEGNYGITGDSTTGPGVASWTANVDTASVFDYNAIQPGGVRTIKYPGSHNTLVPLTFDAGFAVTPSFLCSDGKPVGADVAGILSGIPGLDLSK